MADAEVIRPAQVPDVSAICDLVNYYAERGKMLHRSLESAYESLREFIVAQNSDARVVGCVAVAIYWADLGEVRSLAVEPHLRGRGVGWRLLEAAIEEARKLGIKRLFTLTYEQEFFARKGFEVVDREKLPEKVWRVCISCPKADACDETAMMLSL